MEPYKFVMGKTEHGNLIAVAKIGGKPGSLVLSIEGIHDRLPHVGEEVTMYFDGENKPAVFEFIKVTEEYFREGEQHEFVGQIEYIERLTDNVQ